MFERKSKIIVTVDKSHLFTLGEKMYRESIEFIRELVNNAYDADATEVYVRISDDKIEVEDDGSGMNEKGLDQFFTPLSLVNFTRDFFITTNKKLSFKMET